MINYSEITNSGPDILTWLNGQARFRIWTAGEDCSSVIAKANSLSGPALLAYISLLERPVTPDGEELSETFCGNIGEIYAQISDEDFYGATSPATGAGTGMPTKTAIQSTNTDTFKPEVQWQNGKARIVNTVNPSVPNGQTLRYWIGGMPFVLSLPTEYTLDPGDRVQIMAVVSTTPYVYESDWYQKSNCLITIGPAPTN